jgi:hypothetical protein
VTQSLFTAANRALSGKALAAGEHGAYARSSFNLRFLQTKGLEESHVVEDDAGSK